MDYVAVEVEFGDYTLRPPPPRPKRIFLHNPLHDYEPIWWIAVWFPFCSHLNGLSKGKGESLRHMVYANRGLTLSSETVHSACELLLEALRLAGEALNEMRVLLCDAYRQLEQAFDGAGILGIFTKFRRLLLELSAKPQEPPTMPYGGGSDSEIERGGCGTARRGSGW
jgi:hypothetical protein